MVERERVLLVEDDPELANLYTRWLEPAYTVSTAVTGEAALDLVDAETDIVLLDRMLPDQSGDAVLHTIRERGLDCSVVMMTAIEPGLDLIDLPVDDYLTKPITATALQGTIARIRRRRTYDDALGRWFGLLSKRATLEETFHPDDLEGHPDYQALLEEIEACQPDVRTVRESLDDTDAIRLFTGTIDTK